MLIRHRASILGSESEDDFPIAGRKSHFVKVYVTGGGRETALPTGDTYMNYYTNFTPQHQANFVNVSQFATDQLMGTLPQVALIESGSHRRMRRSSHRRAP